MLNRSNGVCRSQDTESNSLERLCKNVEICFVNAMLKYLRINVDTVQLHPEYVVACLIVHQTEG